MFIGEYLFGTNEVERNKKKQFMLNTDETQGV
jgi:hypothetical protein